MHRNALFSTFLAFVLCFITATAFAQDKPAIAPLTHDHHTRQYNPDHPTVRADDKRFHTDREAVALDLPAEEEAFTFVIFGDRTGGPNEGIDVLAQAVADTNLLEPDLVMTVGDLIDGYNQTPGWMQQMKQYKSVMGELICPWFPVAGNHDVYWRGPNKPKGEHENSYELHFGPLWYAFEHKNAYFIALYTDEGDPTTGIKNFNEPSAQRMSDEQFNWLKGRLAHAKEKQLDHVFIFVHHPRWLNTRRRHVGYGDDWGKVHAELVKAGNVSGVFAGHIHHMRYDPQDGIDYFTLATVGGGQPGWSPRAGWRHQFHVVTVRKNQVAFASLPVGAVDDPKAITGQVSEQSEKLGRAMPITYERALKIQDDGSVDDSITMTVNNPSIFEIDVELTPTSADSRWTITPDHRHQTIGPGESATLSFSIKRPADAFDLSARPIVTQLGIDLLAGSRRYPIPMKRISVPGSLAVQ